MALRLVAVGSKHVDGSKLEAASMVDRLLADAWLLEAFALMLVSGARLVRAIGSLCESCRQPR